MNEFDLEKLDLEKNRPRETMLKMGKKLKK